MHGYEYVLESQVHYCSYIRQLVCIWLCQHQVCSYLNNVWQCYSLHGLNVLNRKFNADSSRKLIVIVLVYYRYWLCRHPRKHHTKLRCTYNYSTILKCNYNVHNPLSYIYTYTIKPWTYWNNYPFLLWNVVVITY